MSTCDKGNKSHKVVISGIAGRFPKSDNVAEFQQNLLNAVDCTTTDHGRWEYDTPKIPQCIGKCNNIQKFDRVFFGVHAKLTALMDPLPRLILEHSFEAVIDAGINPKSLRGANISVYSATNISESEKTIFNTKVQKDGFGIMGGSKAMLPNRVSFFLGLTGPSVNLDSGCTGSASALERAYYDVKNGLSDGALVIGCIVCLHAHLSYQMKTLGQLSNDGKTRSFDDSADGHTRSDSMAVLFLQRAEDAKRIYQEVVHVKQLYSVGNPVNSVIYPTVESQIKIMKDVLDESGLTSDDISFLEASGMGIKERDAEELQAIDAVYGKRDKPLLMGSVKSVIGNAIPANTINGIIKMIVASETGRIPPNLHYETPNSEASNLLEGRVKIPTELVPWTGPYSAVSTTSAGGAVAGVILKAPNIEKKNNGVPADKLQRLVVVSGRTEEAVQTLLDFVESRPLDVELMQMMYDVFESGIDGYLYRGITIIPAEGLLPEDSKKREMLFNTGENREIWWIFSGMGSQWAGMGEALLKLPLFEESIRKCDNVLKPLGYDIFKIITDKDPHTFDYIVNSFIGIAAIQVALVDVLRALGLEPDRIIGHSVGELGCAYADGCLTAEQMVLAALSRGLASVETELIEGSMAAVGLGYDDIKPLCPPDIDVACHNGPDSSTISGPAASMKEFVASLTAKGIFAREVPCSKIAYHSRYIADAGSKLLEKLQTVIPKPKPRSAKWVSTSVPRGEWNNMKARLCSAEYHTNNLLNPVLFEETSRLIPDGAICIEIAPHGLLQAIVKKSLPKTCINIPLTRRGHPDNLELLLAAVGKLYNVGLQPRVSNLYPKVQYPVGRGTPSLSSLIKWDHSMDWPVHYSRSQGKVQEGEITFEIDLNEGNFAYLQGYVVNGKISIPLSFYLMKTSEIFRSFHTEPILNVVFENIQVHELISAVPDDDKITLTFSVPKGTGKFEVAQAQTLLLSGSIKTTQTPNKEKLDLFKSDEEMVESYELDRDDFYTEMEMRGYKYTDQFRTVLSSSIDGKRASLEWTNNWVTYLDGALQFYTFQHDLRQIEMPLSIRKIVIDNDSHESVVKGGKGTDVFVDKNLGYLSAGGLEIQGIKLSVVPKVFEQSRVSADKTVVVPNVQDSIISVATSMRLILQLVIENIFTSTTPVIQVVKHLDYNRIKLNVMNNIPEAALFKIEYDICYEEATFNKALTILEGQITNYDLTEISKKVKSGKFILAFVDCSQQQTLIKSIDTSELKVVFMRRLNSEYIVLLKKKQTISKLHTIDISHNLLDSLSKIQAIKGLSDCERILVNVKSGADVNIDQLIGQLERRLNLKDIRIYDFRNMSAPNHLLVKMVEEQIELDILVNIALSENNWATSRCAAVSPKPQKLTSWRANQIYSHDPTTFTWTEGPSVTNNPSTVKVEYSSLNSQDLLIANGTFYGNSSKPTGKNRLNPVGIGLEFSGIDANGNRVMGITRGNAMSNYIVADKDWTWNVPKSWSLEDAATVPLSYAVAYSACYIKADIKPKDRVIIVNPCTDFGIASLNLALQANCDVLVTYQNEEDRQLLRSIVPNIQEKNVIKFVNATFRDAVLAATQGKGVDVVICNKCEIKDKDLLFSVLGHDARIIFISDLNHNMVHDSIGMFIFLREAGFSTVIPEKVLLADLKSKKLIASMLKEGIKAGHVKPLPKKLYARNSLNEALNACKENNQRAKIVVRTQPEGSTQALSLPRLYCTENESYIIFEGLTLMGLELIDWLIVRGAKNCIVTSSTKVDSGFAKLRMKYWKDYGVHITLHEEFKYSDIKLVELIFEEARALGKIDGVFDLRLSNTDKSSSCLNSFETTTSVIDQETRALGAQLRTFVVFSVENLVENNKSHSINEDVCSYIQRTEKILNKRKEDGLSGLLIRWKVNASLPVSKYIQKLDEILGTEDSIAEVSYFAPASKKIEQDIIAEEAYRFDPEREEYESFTASLYKGHGVHVDFYSLELEI